MEHTSPSPERDAEIRKLLIAELAATNTSMERRIQVATELFPASRKEALKETADKNIQDKPVTYFRAITYGELQYLLNERNFNAFTNPNLEREFTDNIEYTKQQLISAIESLGLSQDGTNAYEDLLSDFTLENYATFVLTFIPRRELFEIHAQNSFAGNAQGLISLSVGAPFLPPYDPVPHDKVYELGGPVVEMIIPSSEIIVSPIDTNSPDREMEKEVNVVHLRPEWIVDLYQGNKDFTTRFTQDPKSPLYPFYEQSGQRSIEDSFDFLQDWKADTPLESVIPAAKIDELNSENPIHAQPLAESMDISQVLNELSKKS